jgi:hypothetical protein
VDRHSQYELRWTREHAICHQSIQPFLPGVEIPRDRNLKFAIETAELPVGDGLQKVLLIGVKKPKRKRVVTRPSNLTPEQKAEQLQARRQRAAERKANPSRQIGSAGDQQPTGQQTREAAAGAQT